MRRLRRRVREAEKEKLKKLYEQLSAGNTVAHCPSDKRTVSFHIRQPGHNIERTWEKNSLLMSKLAKSTISLHKKQPHRKSRTWPENSPLTSKLAKSTVLLHRK